jgi:N6-adenosine-specific RNA methylase IME4
VTVRATLIVDPPWPYTTKITDKRIRGFSGEHYRSMSIGQLAGLQIGKLGSHLFLWTTVAYTEDAFKLVRAWGFKPITMLFWVKAKGLTPFVGQRRFTPGYGTGYWFRGAVEPIIVAKKANAKSVRSPYIGLISPNMRHSMKPIALHEIVEETSGVSPSIHRVVRERRPTGLDLPRQFHLGQRHSQGHL